MHLYLYVANAHRPTYSASLTIIFSVWKLHPLGQGAGIWPVCVTIAREKELVSADNTCKEMNPTCVRRRLTSGTTHSLKRPQEVKTRNRNNPWPGVAPLLGYAQLLRCRFNYATSSSGSSMTLFSCLTNRQMSAESSASGSVSRGQRTVYKAICGNAGGSDAAFLHALIASL